MPENLSLFASVETPTIIKISLRNLNMNKIFRSASYSSLHHLHHHLHFYYHLHPHRFHHHHLHHHHLLLQHHRLYHLYRISNLPIIHNCFYSSQQLYDIDTLKLHHMWTQSWEVAKDKKRKKRTRNKNSNLMTYLIYYEIIFCICAIL